MQPRGAQGGAAGAATSLSWLRLSGGRLAGVALALSGADAADAAWAGVKAVTAKLQSSGKFAFGISAKQLRACLAAGLAVLIVGVDADGVAIVAYVLHGPEDLAAVQGLTFGMFQPVLDR